MVLPSNTACSTPSTGPELTLTTCNPRYSAATRLVVVATLPKGTDPAQLPGQHAREHEHHAPPPLKSPAAAVDPGR